MAPARAGGRRGGGAGSRKEDPPGAIDTALRYLAARPRTVAEVRKHLRGRGCGRAAADEAIRRLAAMGYLDDRAYAERYVAAAGSGRPKGSRRIRLDLLRRGIDRAVVNAVLAERFGPAEESAALEEALAKASRGSSGPIDAAARRRIAARLMRRGFAPGQVMRAMAARGGADGRLDLEEDDDRRGAPVEEGEI